MELTLAAVAGGGVATCRGIMTPRENTSLPWARRGRFVVCSQNREDQA